MIFHKIPRKMQGETRIRLLHLFRRFKRRIWFQHSVVSETKFDSCDKTLTVKNVGRSPRVVANAVGVRLKLITCTGTAVFRLSLPDYN